MSEINEQERLARSKRWFLLVWTAIGFVGILVALSYALNILATPVNMLIWTVIIVFCLRNLVAMLERHGIGRLWGTLISYLVMVAVLGIAAVLMVSPTIGLGSQFISLIDDAPNYINKVSAWISAVYDEYSYVFNNEMFQNYLNQATTALSSAAQDIARQSAQGVVSLSSGIANLAMAVGFALVVAFWVLMELPAIGRECNRLIAGSKYEEDFRMLHVTLTRVMAGYIKATLLQCFIIAVACGILYFILNVPNFAAVALITGVLNIIPVVGPWLGGAMAAALGLAVSPITSLIIFLGTIIIQQVVYTLVSPRLMENSVDIHPALTLVCLLIGSALGTVMSGLPGSILGMLVAVPAAAVFKSLFVYYFEKNTGNQIVAEDGVFFKGTPSEGEGVDPMGDVSAPHPDSTARFDRITQADIEGRLGKRRGFKGKGGEKDKSAAAAGRVSEEAPSVNEDELRAKLMSLHIPGEDGIEDKSNGTTGSGLHAGDPTSNNRTDR